ncbi:MAG: hypothetical protein AB1634_11905 [Thermodesulfobacteriota bacterium]
MLIIRSENRKRREIFGAQDAIDGQRAALIAGIERQIRASPAMESLFSVRWTLV